MPKTSEQASQVRVRMHRQGLGDCFLVSVLRGSGQRAFHMLIDCGVILGTEDTAERLRRVVESVIAETGGFVDILVVTHEHYDHVAGFVLAAGLFATPDDADTAGKLSVGEVWFAWTEDPSNELANQLRRERDSQLRALSAMAMRLGLAAAENAAPSLSAAMNFFGVEPDGKGLGTTAQAMRNAAGLVPPDAVHYHRPGAVLSPRGAPELRIRVLGPPTDRASLKRTDSTREVYQLDGEGLEPAVRLTAAEVEASDGASPFGPGWSLPLRDLDKEPAAEFFRRHYFGKAGGADQSWRRVDGAWLANSEGLALALDGATNNTSLVLAIEIVGSGKVLLFAADAQVGNWQSWQNLSWPDDAGHTVTSKDLLARTVFYKVGHHGSHNATLRAHGLEQMPEEGLVAFIPVDHEMASRKGWKRMPLPGLVEALRARCGDHLVRIDEEPAASLEGISTGGEGFGYGSLYVDWTLPL